MGVEDVQAAWAMEGGAKFALYLKLCESVSTRKGRRQGISPLWGFC